MKKLKYIALSTIVAVTLSMFASANESQEADEKNEFCILGICFETYGGGGGVRPTGDNKESKNQQRGGGGGVRPTGD